ncbi:glycosyltransferase [Desulfonatronum sp. SC1]|uniref:glycosyltransferase n=1 Tax=Desulfonatronum sp. SC1 TaxID=2109626 RepID=UPI000D30B25C|nr:glycosyltransferase [Desulfonatronum sp. SC1]PTN31611.1 undecaprenyl-phosphate 4-deoxy-4-formamido-L-arabinose transferase [Desulfonatronum sp. SC1]
MSATGLSVVIPVFNEQDCLPELIKRCLAACGQTGRAFEIILVDDGSRDGSREIISQAADASPEVVGVFLNRNYGQHAAVFAGLEQSRGEVVVTLDADLQNPPEEIPRLVQEMDRGVDVVGTVRENRRDSLFRRVASSLVNRIVQRVTGVMMHDYGCMLRAYRRPIVKAMLQCAERSTFIPILANSFAGSTAEIRVSHAPRNTGKSKYSLLKLISLQFDLLTSLSTFPLRLLSFFGALIAASGIGFGLLLMVLRFAYGAQWAGEGVFTLFAILFIFIGAQFVGLGLLGEYIGRIYHDVRGRPRFFIQEIKRASQPTAFGARGEASQKQPSLVEP